METEDDVRHLTVKKEVEIQENKFLPVSNTC